MPFCQKIKENVRRQAWYVLFLQKNSMRLEIHQLPRRLRGAYLEENEAPLCPTWHADFGGNPDHRARLRDPGELLRTYPYPRLPCENATMQLC